MSSIEDGGLTSLSQAKSGSNSLNQAKQFRITISSKNHQDLLLSVASQLGTNNPKQAIEHILNCWLVGNVPPSGNAPIVTGANGVGVGIEADSDTEDEFSGLMEF